MYHKIKPGKSHQKVGNLPQNCPKKGLPFKALHLLKPSLEASWSLLGLSSDSGVLQGTKMSPRGLQNYPKSFQNGAGGLPEAMPKITQKVLYKNAALLRKLSKMAPKLTYSWGKSRVFLTYFWVPSSNMPPKALREASRPPKS